MLTPILPPAGAAELRTGLGYRQLQTVDQHQSPLRYVGHAPQLEVGLTHQGRRLTAWGELDAHAGSFAAAGVERPLGGALLGGGGAQLGLAAGITPGPVRISLGGAVHKSLEYGDSMALHPWGLGLTSVDLRARADASLGRQRLSVDVGVPVAGWVTRHVWSLDPVVPGKGALPAFYQVGTDGFSVASLQAVYGNARLTVPLGSGRSAFTAGLGGRYLTYSEPRPIQMLTWQATTSITTTLGRR